jgi:tetratricopeptide (TPR) repeat protein
MRNLLFAILAGVVLWACLTLAPGLSILQSILPGILAAALTYYLLAKRAFKQLESVLTRAAKSLQTMPPKFDLAISEMEKAYALAPIQIGVRSQVDAQIGVVYFLQQKFDKALPYLERSLAWGHWLGGAMLAVIYYKKKNPDEMRKTMEIVVKRSKNQALPWCLYGYLLVQSGDREAAQSTLVKGVKASKEDQKVKDALLAVQNNRKIKMKVFKEQWYQFHLERPPAQYQQVMVGGKVSKQQRRGRW